MRPRLWQVGIFHDDEPVFYGPMSRERAEELFKELSRHPMDGSTAFIQPMPTKQKRWLPW